MMNHTRDIKDFLFMGATVLHCVYYTAYIVTPTRGRAERSVATDRRWIKGFLARRPLQDCTALRCRVLE